MKHLWDRTTPSNKLSCFRCGTTPDDTDDTCHAGETRRVETPNGRSAVTGRFITEPHDIIVTPVGGQAEPAKVYDAVRDLLWRATQYGETDDGDTASYLLSKGTVHRLVGAMQAIGQSAPLRNPLSGGQAEPANERISALAAAVAEAQENARAGHTEGRDEDYTRFWHAAAGWLKARIKAIERGEEPHWPDAAVSGGQAEPSDAIGRALRASLDANQTLGGMAQEERQLGGVYLNMIQRLRRLIPHMEEPGTAGGVCMKCTMPWPCENVPAAAAVSGEPTC